MWNVFSHWKIFGLQMSHDLRQRRSTSWISHSFHLVWIKLIVLSHIFVLLQSLRREEGFGAKILRRHEWIPDSSLKKYLSCACKVTRYHTLVSWGRWFTLRLNSLYTLAYSQDAALNRSPATFLLKTNASFSFPMSVLSEAFSGAVTVDLNWCWQCSQNYKKRGQKCSTL